MHIIIKQVLPSKNYPNLRVQTEKKKPNTEENNKANYSNLHPNIVKTIILNNNANPTNYINEYQVEK